MNQDEAVTAPVEYTFNSTTHVLTITPEHPIYIYNFVYDKVPSRNKPDIRYIRTEILNYTFRGDIESWTDAYRREYEEVVPPGQLVYCVIRGTLFQNSPRGYRLESVSSVSSVTFKTPFSLNL